MENAEKVFASFERCKYGYDWSGEVAYPFWDGKSLLTYIAIDYDITHPTRRQLLLLGHLLEYERNIRPSVEVALFDHYQSNIYGSVSEFGRNDQWEELTPTLKSSDEIWKLLGDPSVKIDYLADGEPDEGLCFLLSFYECPWDKEHGFGIQMLDWKIDGFDGR